MELNDIKSIWKKGSRSPDNDKPLTMEVMESIITKRSKAVKLKIRFDIYLSLLVYVVTIGLAIFNTIRYINSPNLVWILPALIIILIMLTIQSARMIPGMNHFTPGAESLRRSIAATISYFKKKYVLWQFLFPVGVIILSFNANIIVDYDPSGYNIHHPGVFVAVYSAMYVFIYGVFRVTRRIYIADLENCLKNLDSEEYTSIEKSVRRSRLFTLGFVTGLLILFLGALFMYFRATGKI